MMAFLLAALLGTVTFRTELGVGADYTTQRYQVGTYDTLNWEWQEEDTLNIETEGRTALTLKLGLDRGSTRFDATNTASASTRSVRDALGLSFEQDFGLLSLRAGNDAEARAYHRWFPSLADTSYGGRDYFSNSSRLELRLRASDAFRFSVYDGFDLLRYAQPDSYYYGYHLNRLRLAGFWEPAFFTSADAGGTWIRRRAGQDAGRNYDELSASAGLEHSFGAKLRLAAANDLRRRAYGNTVGSFVEEELSFDAGWSAGALGFELENDARWTVYDSASTAYISLFEDGVKLGFELSLRPDLNLRLGPRADLGVGLAGPGEDDYRELSGFAGLALFGTGRWLNADVRVGRRSYPYADTAWQSDYTFGELSAFGSWTVFRSGSHELRLDAMASVTPEWHARKSDNFLFTVYSLDLKYGF